MLGLKLNHVSERGPKPVNRSDVPGVEVHFAIDSIAKWTSAPGPTLHLFQKELKHHRLYNRSDEIVIPFGRDTAAVVFASASRCS